MIDDFKKINLWSATDIEFDKRTGERKVKSTFPAFCFPRKMEELEEHRSSLNARLNADIKGFGTVAPLIDDSAKADVRAEVRMYDERIDSLKESKQEISSALRDRIVQTYRNMGDLIAESLFSVTAQREGYVDSHEELRRMTAFIIPINNDIAQWFKKCNQPVRDDKMTNRNILSICWKIAGHYIGEETNIERLRPTDPWDGTMRKADVMAEQGV